MYIIPQEIFITDEILDTLSFMSNGKYICFYSYEPPKYIYKRRNIIGLPFHWEIYSELCKEFFNIPIRGSSDAGFRQLKRYFASLTEQQWELLHLQSVLMDEE